MAVERKLDDVGWGMGGLDGFDLVTNDWGVQFHLGSARLRSACEG